VEGGPPDAGNPDHRYRLWVKRGGTAEGGRVTLSGATFNRSYNLHARPQLNPPKTKKFISSVKKKNHIFETKKEKPNQMSADPNLMPLVGRDLVGSTF